MYVLHGILVVTMGCSIDSLDVFFRTQVADPQDFYRGNKDENVHQPLCIDYPNVTSGIRKLSATTYIMCSHI